MRTRPIRSSSDPVQSPAKAKEVHRPVLLFEVLDRLAIKEDDIVVDATLGGAGHASAIAAKLGKHGKLIGFDMDEDAIERAETALTGTRAEVQLIRSNFRELGSALTARGITSIDKVLFDLGWSSYQLDAGRGFSFLRDEPLRMTYAKEGQSLTAREIVNRWEESSLADIIYGWGGERLSRKIAKAIVDRREKQPFETSLDLAEAIKAAVPRAYARGRIHPATRTFQALRIAVNDELGAVEDGINAAWRMLRPGGRIAVITFHSLEDRIVKMKFKAFALDGSGTLVDKKPLVPTLDETVHNPRSRSAKLRVIEKNQPEI